MVKINMTKDTGPQPKREENWVGPTGRTLTPGTTFRVQDKQGTFVFVAYVTPVKGEPYVEAIKSGKVRCIYPDKIYKVSNRKGGPDA